MSAIEEFHLVHNPLGRVMGSWVVVEANDTSPASTSLFTGLGAWPPHPAVICHHYKELVKLREDMNELKKETNLQKLLFVIF
ncbi:MAG: hypothetical protein G5Z43_000787 [Caldisphaeraceae archaeon]|nr:hypothetical protein [Caldisphaeraceae archaeon]MEB3691431.1 hypothetical protein [Caldisphaeraceae archaeon]